MAVWFQWCLLSDLRPFTFDFSTSHFLTVLFWLEPFCTHWDTYFYKKGSWLIWNQNLRLKAMFYEGCRGCKSVQGNVYPIISTNPICVVQIKFIFRHCQQLISSSIQLNLQFSKPKAKMFGYFLVGMVREGFETHFGSDLIAKWPMISVDEWLNLDYDRIISILDALVC